jgi:hypothetical protein
MDEKNNMHIWSQVCTTDPKHTKAVSFGRKFTSIDAHYQVMRATEVFGPVGQCWSYSCVYGQEVAGTIPYVWCDMTIHWGLPVAIDEAPGWGNQNFSNAYGPIRCTCPMLDAKGRLDKDAPKKAMTDCLTKGLSHLGFNADVFLGKFDDNAYVAAMEEKFKEQAPEIVQQYLKEVAAATSVEQLQKINDDLGPQMAQMKSTHASAISEAAAAWNVKKRQLGAVSGNGLPINTNTEE